jgi:hypothetical protein
MMLKLLCRLNKSLFCLLMQNIEDFEIVRIDLEIYYKLNSTSLK